MIQRLQWLYPPIAQKFFFNLINILCDRLENVTHCLSEASLEDDLTSLCNRKGFLKTLETEAYRARRFGEDIALSVIKVGFDSSNPRPEFDDKNRLLRLLGETLSRNARKCDTYGRLDTQTFALLMPKTSKEKAQKVCDRLLNIIEGTPFKTDGLSLEVTINIVDLDDDTLPLSGEALLEKTQMCQPAS